MATPFNTFLPPDTFGYGSKTLGTPKHQNHQIFLKLLTEIFQGNNNLRKSVQQKQKQRPLVLESLGKFGKTFSKIFQKTPKIPLLIAEKARQKPMKSLPETFQKSTRNIQAKITYFPQKFCLTSSVVKQNIFLGGGFSPLKMD